MATFVNGNLRQWRRTSISSGNQEYWYKDIRSGPIASYKRIKAVLSEYTITIEEYEIVMMVLLSLVLWTYRLEKELSQLASVLAPTDIDGPKAPQKPLAVLLLMISHQDIHQTAARQSKSISKSGNISTSPPCSPLCTDSSDRLLIINCLR